MVTIILFTTGPVGVGKSFVRCARFLINEFLPERGGVHWSNFPLGEVPEGFEPTPPRFPGETFVDRIVEEVAKNKKQDRQAEDEYRDRIKTIPRSVIDTWCSGESGPWEYFSEEDLGGAHIALDEIHNMCGFGSSRHVKQRWLEWLGEIRHLGATIEFITQEPDKVYDKLVKAAALRVELVPAAVRRDGFCKIPMHDWYELAAGITGVWCPCVWEVEYRREMGRWIVNNTRKWRMDAHYYNFYDSFEKPLKGGNAGRTEKLEHQKRRLPSLCWWFFRRYPVELATRAAVACLLVWLIFFGGGGVLMGVMIERFTGYVDQAVPSHQAQASEHAEPVRQPEPLSSGSNTSGGDRQAGRAAGSGEAGLRRELEAARERIAQLEARLQAVHHELQVAQDALHRASEVVLVAPDSVTFRGGYSYAAGQVIDFGPYQGRTIESINYERRSVHLDDGEVLRMGHPVRRPADGVPVEPEPDA